MSPDDYEENVEEETQNEENVEEETQNEEKINRTETDEEIILPLLNVDSDVPNFTTLADESLPTDEVVEPYIEKKRISKSIKSPNNLKDYKVEDENSAFYQVIICPICQEEYCTETGDPRTLECGHNICSGCLTKLYQNKSQYNDHLECPVCRHKLKEKLCEIKTSYLLKNLVSKYKEIKEKLQSCMPCEQHLSEAAIGHCKQHSLPLHFGCTFCNEWLCGKCVCMNHSGIEKECKIFPLNEAISRKEVESRSDLVNRKKVLNDQLNEYKNLISSLSEITKHFIELKKNPNNISTNIESNSTLRSIEENTSNKILQEMLISRDQLMSSVNVVGKTEALSSYWKMRRSWNRDVKNKYSLDAWNMWIINNLRSANSMSLTLKDQSNDVASAKITFHGNETTMKVFHLKEHYHCPRVSFFHPMSFHYYSFIDIRNEAGGPTVRLKFEVDLNPLGYAFLKRCNATFHQSFIGSSISNPFKEYLALYFGSLDHPSFHGEKFVLGDCNKYKKPLTKGVIGMYNNYENDKEMVTGSIKIYINMVTNESERRILPYIDGNTYDGYCLKYCFGKVVEGLVELELLMERNNGQFCVTDCGINIDI